MISLNQGWPRLFCSWAKFENYFSSRAALFKIVSYDKVTTSAKQKKIGLFMLLLTVFDQLSGSRRSMLLFLLPEKRSKGRTLALAMSGLNIQLKTDNSYYLYENRMFPNKASYTEFVNRHRFAQSCWISSGAFM